MAKKIATVPKGYRTATPTLVVNNARAAIAFYEAVFAATTLNCAYAPDGLTVLQADLKIGTSIIRIGDEMPEFGIVSPTTLGGSPAPVHLYVDAADDVWQRALAAGSTVAVPLADAYWGERYGRFVDPFGHIWSVEQRLEVLSASQVAARAAAFFAPACTDFQNSCVVPLGITAMRYLTPPAPDALPPSPESDAPPPQPISRPQVIQNRIHLLIVTTPVG